MAANSLYDVIVVGGGPAGLSAALVLGRCCRRVLVIDSGRPRNAAARALHGFLSRDGIQPTSLIKIAREQLELYENVELRFRTVVYARRRGHQFVVRLDDGTRTASRKLILATGVTDSLPSIEGVAELYGSSVFHCPYCDGWEFRDKPIAVYGLGTKGVGLAQTLSGWSRDIVLCTDNGRRMSGQQFDVLSKLGIVVRDERIARLEGVAGKLQRIVFANGQSIRREAVFFNTAQYQRSELPAQLGCRITSKDSVVTNSVGETSVPGVYLAGDASRDVQLANVAAAEGAKAAFAVNKALLSEREPLHDRRARSQKRGAN